MHERGMDIRTVIPCTTKLIAKTPVPTKARLDSSMQRPHPRAETVHGESSQKKNNEHAPMESLRPRAPRRHRGASDVSIAVQERSTIILTSLGMIADLLPALCPKQSPADSAPLQTHNVFGYRPPCLVKSSPRTATAKTIQRTCPQDPLGLGAMAGFPRPHARTMRRQTA
eukprot:5772852-Pyramimonas_sp.AAC.1